jgi:hypothetical protein
VDISEFALHEVLHLLFAGREIPENEEHGIINRLLPVILCVQEID